MDADFAVDVAELRRTALEASNLSVELDGSSLPRQALSGVAGSDAVDHAYSGFVSHWSDGLAQVRQQLADLAKRLGSAAESYQSTDDGIGQAAAVSPPVRSDTCAPE